MQSPLNIWNTAGYGGIDSSVFQTVAFYMSKGYMPYKDVFDHKGPLIYIYNWIGMQISYGRGIWLLEYVSLFITFFILYKIARLTSPPFISALTLFISGSGLFGYFQGGNLTEEYALPFLSVGVLIFTDFFLNNKISKIRLILSGFCFGAVCLLRINMISVWVAFPIAVLIKCIYEKNIVQIRKLSFYFGLGTLTITIPILSWLICNGAFAEFLSDYLIFNILYVRAPSTGIINKINVVNFFLNNTLVLITGISVIYLGVQKKDYFHISYIGYFIVTLMSILLSGRTYAHYAMVLIPVMIYPMAQIINKVNWRIPAQLCATIYTILSICVPCWLIGANKVVEAYLSRKLQQTRTDTISQVVDLIIENTDADSRITVWGNACNYYILSRRLSASKYIYQSPIGDINPIIYDEYFRELEKKKPEIIIVTTNMGKMEEFITEYNYQLLNAYNEGAIKIFAD